MAHPDEMEGRVTALELWKHRADVDLYGVPGTPEIGLVKDRANEKAEKKGKQDMTKWVLAIIGVCQAVLTLAITWEKLHKLLN